MQLTGHKSEAMYRRYAIVIERDLREGVEKHRAPGEPTRRAHGGPLPRRGEELGPPWSWS